MLRLNHQSQGQVRTDHDALLRFLKQVSSDALLRFLKQVSSDADILDSGPGDHRAVPIPSPSQSSRGRTAPLHLGRPRTGPEALSPWRCWRWGWGRRFSGAWLEPTQLMMFARVQSATAFLL